MFFLQRSARLHQQLRQRPGPRWQKCWQSMTSKKDFGRHSTARRVCGHLEEKTMGTGRRSRTRILAVMHLNPGLNAQCIWSIHFGCRMDFSHGDESYKVHDCVDEGTRKGVWKVCFVRTNRCGTNTILPERVSPAVWYKMCWTVRLIITVTFLDSNWYPKKVLRHS